MGRVLPYVAIESGLLPTYKKDTPDTIETLRNELTMCEGVVGAVLMGSMLKGDHTLRSDIDVLVLEDSKNIQACIRLRQQFKLMTDDYGIPIQFIPVSNQVAGTTLHPLSYGLYQHAQRSISLGGCIKENPLPYFEMSRLTPSDDVAFYLQHKLYSLGQGLGIPRANPLADLEECRDYLRVLQRSLEAPVHLARKILTLKGILPEDDRKQVVVERYLEQCPTAQATCLRSLWRADTAYTQHLEEQLERPCGQDYAAFIDRLSHMPMMAYQFFLEVAKELINSGQLLR